jgi:hypothetical protein
MQMFDTQTLNTCTWIELNILYPLTRQAILGYLIINFMVAVASHRGNLQLAAANLGSSGIQLFPYGLKVMLATINYYKHITWEWNYKCVLYSELTFPIGDGHEELPYLNIVR